ncbi:tetratricopeptide repeat protein [Halalkalibacterium halodurans]|uniref:tetratricopeptide repeat protein n=1 Tax=Halalkalibacterium halodurans TaxID=86665 RepID=UPI002E1ED03C|nr:tetratricopeptide repeat protein [Halalkalibacterium halodurans]MED4083422.1 tetratricopeptide repeat protein [Halalkalibacterium halodurans]MED4107081.1 tetratricopeptide repeat protein [Halalkalibacterium halodurans]MED4126031.1 tetratricopeptide repeat protein [Halalkalibacterium halodurans]MED4188582.1 tetratricopeptide repeat protein [Halalkalibacterium halodurans]
MDVSIESGKKKIIPFIQSGDYFFRRGVIAFRKNHLSRAVKLLERAVKLTEQEPVFHIQLAAVLSELGHYERSNDILESVVQNLDPGHSECHFFMANNYAYLGLFEKAEHCAIAYLSDQPDGEFAKDAHDLLDLLRFEKEEEGDEWENELTPTDQFLLEHEKACQLLEEGHLQEAIVLLEKLMDEEPSYWTAYNQYAQALFRLGNVEKAFEVCEHILEEDQGNLFALCNMALFYKKQGQQQQAESLIQALSAVHPMDRAHRFKVAQVLCAVGAYEQAYDRLKELEWTSISSDPEWHFCIGVAAYHLGQEEIALRYWKKAATLGVQQAADYYAMSIVDILQKEDVTYEGWHVKQKSRQNS